MYIAHSIVTQNVMVIMENGGKKSVAKLRIEHKQRYRMLYTERVTFLLSFIENVLIILQK